MSSSGTSRRVTLVRTEVSEERIASIINSLILVTLMMAAICSSETPVLTRPQVATSQKRQSSQSPHETLKSYTALTSWTL
jgi:hypothetical protein